METKLPEIGKRFMSNLNWKLILGSALSGTTVGSVYGYYSINYVHTSSGTYKISAPPPHPQLLSRKGQVEICKTYVKLFERAHNRHYISDIDYSPVLKKLCGINPGDILINMYG